MDNDPGKLIVTLVECKSVFNDGIIPADTLAFVVSERTGSYYHTLRFCETPGPARVVGTVGLDFKLPRSQENKTWKFVVNDGASQSLQVPGACLQEVRAIIDTASSTTTETDRNAALENAQRVLGIVLEGKA